MDNLIGKSSCGRSLFINRPGIGFVNPDDGGTGVSNDSEITFLVSDNPILYLQLGTSNESGIENLSHKIARNPQDLRAHIQRLVLYMRTQDNDGVYASLIDLFISLGEKGISIRERMLTLSKPFLSNRQILFFRNIMQRGIRATDPLPDVQMAVLSKGYIGKNNFVVENSHTSCTNRVDPRQEAIDCLIYGQVDEARKILEEAVLQEPWREDLQTDLLEIYWATRDLHACQAMYERLADEFIPEHHAWIEVVERISDALGGV